MPEITQLGSSRGGTGTQGAWTQNPDSLTIFQGRLQTAKSSLIAKQGLFPGIISFSHPSILVRRHSHSQFSQMQKRRLRESQGHFKGDTAPALCSPPSSASYLPDPSWFLRGHAGHGAHLESGSWQVGDGNILEVILQGVDERGHRELECVHILHQDSLVEEEHQVLHVTWGVWGGGGQPSLALKIL